MAFNRTVAPPYGKELRNFDAAAIFAFLQHLAIKLCAIDSIFHLGAKRPSNTTATQHT